jgi:fused signal recognition particle receptor
MVFRAFFDKIKRGLAKTRGVFSGVAQLFRLKGKVDKDFLKELEKRLYLADVGSAAIAVIVERVRQAFLDKEITGDVEAFVKQQLKEQLLADQAGLHFNPNGPTVVIVSGVNGAGKTTSIAKLARRLKDDGKKVIVAACDTFRAAAVEQLTIWSERLGCEIVKAQPGSDPAAVAHDAAEKAQARGFDVLIVDTAGRLHTQAHLMRELEKISRILKKKIEGAPHEVLLVLDATTGQNAITQAEQFKKTIECTGIILAKLDGTAKGGAIFGIE